MDPFKAKLAEILSYTGYPGNIDNLDFPENAVTSWITQNISDENCLTEEELLEFEALQEAGEVLYGDDLDAALAEYGVSLEHPLNNTFEEIKCDQLERVEHQCTVQKEHVALLKSDLERYKDDYAEMGEKLKTVKAEFASALEKVISDHSIMHSKLNEARERLSVLSDQLNELENTQGLSSDQGILDASTVSQDTSNVSIATTSSSSLEVGNKPYMFQLSFDKFKKKHKRLCQFMKNQLQERLKQVIPEDDMLDAQMLVWNIMKILAVQKETYVKLSADVEHVNLVRTKLKEVKDEILHGTWIPTIESLRDKIAELEGFSILEESRTCSISLEEDLYKKLNEVCTKWAEVQTMPMVVARLDESIGRTRVAINKLEEVESLMNTLLSLDVQLEEMMQLDRERVDHSITLLEKVHSYVKEELSEIQMRVDVLSENIQDYRLFCDDYHGGELVQCLIQALQCEESKVMGSIQEMDEQSNLCHRRLVEHCRNELQVLNSVHSKMKEFIFEEEARRLHKIQVDRDNEHVTSLRDSVQHMGIIAEEAKEICKNLLCD